MSILSSSSNNNIHLKSHRRFDDDTLIQTLSQTCSLINSPVARLKTINLLTQNLRQFYRVRKKFNY